MQPVHGKGIGKYENNPHRADPAQLVQGLLHIAPHLWGAHRDTVVIFKVVAGQMIRHGKQVLCPCTKATLRRMKKNRGLVLRGNVKANLPQGMGKGAASGVQHQHGTPAPLPA